ncbi:hypothetical protein RJ639_040394 [Escallonia herrerae]|uniref:RING-type E3 ubiquitin transferase n=1 Tax=Escallonia herrerae TaxID=1293975 RepID=A0AA88WIY4_9ASTE|nr:hypothetical protein RJ639_040394 [Escallonia herrerae]
MIKAIYPRAVTLACKGGNKVLPILVKICSQEETDELAAQVSNFLMQERMPMTLPASRSSVEALENVSLDLEGLDSMVCAICFQDLSSGSQVVVSRMPCSHVFHEGCIVEWLKHNHLCPLCRFEMPMSSLSDYIGSTFCPHQI